MSEVATPVIDAPVTTPPPAATPVASAVLPNWESSWIKSDRTLDHAALERLPDNLKGMKDTLSKYPTLEAALNGWQNQQVMAGKKALAPLPADAPESVRVERKALMDTINGVPADVKGYGITKPADLPDQHWNPKMAEGFASWAQKHSVAPSAVKELMGLNLSTIKEQLSAQAQGEQQFWTQEQANFDASLKRDGIPADRAQSLVEKGAIALGLDMNDEQTKTMMKGSVARQMAMKHAIAIGEDRVVTGSGGENTGAGNPGELAKSVQNDPSNPLYAVYWNKDGKYSRTDVESARAKVNGWFQQAEARNSKK